MVQINPCFSIVIPTYNRALLLGECLQSLFEQLKPNGRFEIIVVNDGSKTGFADYEKISNKYPQVIYIYSKHKGPAAARNLGIKAAKGDIVLFLDDDSLPTKNWLSSTVKSWEELSDSGGIGGYVASRENDNIYCRINCDLFNWYLKEASACEYTVFLSTCNSGYKKAILNNIGSFDETFDNACGEDRDLSIKIHNIGGKLKMDERIVVFHGRDLALISFLRRHFEYGMAAYMVYSKYPKWKRLSKKAYVNFYIRILKKYKKVSEKRLAFLLLTLSQVSTFIGYLGGIITNHRKG